MSTWVCCTGPGCQIVSKMWVMPHCHPSTPWVNIFIKQAFWEENRERENITCLSIHAYFSTHDHYYTAKHSATRPQPSSLLRLRLRPAGSRLRLRPGDSDNGWGQYSGTSLSRTCPLSGHRTIIREPSHWKRILSVKNCWWEEIMISYLDICFLRATQPKINMMYES